MSTVNRPIVYCDFCGAASHERKVLVASPEKIHICDECISICTEIVASHEAGKASEAQPATEPK